MQLAQRTAKIYQFPTRLRATVGAAAAETRSASSLPAPQTHQASFGAGWYHDAAIEESRRTGKH